MAAGTWVRPIARQQSWWPPHLFRYLNESHLVEFPDWASATRSDLWNYNVHYFEDLVAADAVSRSDKQASLIARWIAENPAPIGIGWDPYPLSLRMVNWIKWLLATNRQSNAIDLSMCLQARWLRRRLERHLRANHLLANAKALFFAGLFFEGSEAQKWLECAIGIYEAELREQVLEDGGHFERSAMYHAIIAEDLLDIVNFSGLYPWITPAPILQTMRVTAQRMIDWLQAMTHPDGNIALFNDAAFGIAPNLVELGEYARRLGIHAVARDSSTSTMTHLADTGYVRANVRDAALIVDVGEIGPRYQPAHGHADTLSFELSLFGLRTIVDSGTSTYSIGPQRALERSTRRHNTVQVDDCDSSEVWSSFRVARRAKPLGVQIHKDGDSVQIRAGHDGYRRLGREITHWRKWELCPGSLRIIDRIDGVFRRAVARIYFHPSVSIRMDGSFVIGGRTCGWSVIGGSVRIAESDWHPEFGLAQPNTFLECEVSGRDLEFMLRW